MPRENSITFVTGQQRIGKSNESVRSIFDEAIPSGRKGLILDINNEYEKYKIHYQDGNTKEVQIPRINHKDIMNFSAQRKIECVRVVPYYDESSERMTPEDIDKFWVAAINNFYGGSELVEDLNKVFGDILPMGLTSVLTNKAHRDVDMFIHMQSVGRIGPKVRQNANYYRYHKQSDPVDESESKSTGALLIAFKLAEIMINNQYRTGVALCKKNENDPKGNRMRRKFVYIEADQNKLIGGFDEPYFFSACQELIRKNPALFRMKELETDINGKKKYSRVDAMQQRAMEIFREHWGN